MSRTSDKELQQQALEMVRKGTLQKDIAKKLQVSERTIRRWVQGNKETNLLITLAEVLRFDRLTGKQLASRWAESECFSDDIGFFDHPDPDSYS